jgi:hypothetical protein
MEPGLRTSRISRGAVAGLRSAIPKVQALPWPIGSRGERAFLGIKANKNTFTPLILETALPASETAVRRRARRVVAGRNEETGHSEFSKPAAKLNPAIQSTYCSLSTSELPTSSAESHAFWTTSALGGASSEWSRLSPTQHYVLEDLRTKAETRSNAARQELLRIADDFGCTEKDLDKCLAYIRDEAPLTINFFPAELSVLGARNIDAFSMDSHYRNAFELCERAQSARDAKDVRDEWERRLFEGGYHAHELIPDERPKYASLNADQDPRGGSRFWGDCFFILSKSIRDRVSLTPDDSSVCDADSVGTFENCQHVLVRANEARLAAILETSRSGKPTPVNVVNAYVEAQIHGPIELSRDIEALVVNQRYAGTDIEAKLRKFAEANGIEMRWTNGKKVMSDLEHENAVVRDISDPA